MAAKKQHRSQTLRQGLTRRARPQTRRVLLLARRAKPQTRRVLLLARRARPQTRRVLLLACRARPKTRRVLLLACRARPKTRRVLLLARRASSETRRVLLLARRAGPKLAGFCFSHAVQGPKRHQGRRPSLQATQDNPPRVCYSHTMQGQNGIIERDGYPCCP